MRGLVLANEPMCQHTTWRIGGPADLFLQPHDSAELMRMLTLLRQHGVPWQIIGSGSNLLVRDGGIRGAVIHLANFNQMRFLGDGAVRAGAGLRLMRLVRASAEQGLSGLEQLSGIPGTVGGAVMMNAGAGDEDIAAAVQSVLLLGIEGCEEWSSERLEFGYRRSTLPEDKVIIEVRLQLQSEEPATLKNAITRRLQHRRNAQGVGKPNAGSVFKNPPGEEAWRLIDGAGLRGAVCGRAQVSERHSNFIVNLGGATAEDVLNLINQVRDRVERKTGIRLETEVRIAGQPKQIDEHRRNYWQE